MATTLYFRSSTDQPRPYGGLFYRQTTWNYTGTSTSHSHSALSTSAGSGTGTTVLTSSVTGPQTAPGMCIYRMWSSPPISSSVTISGTVTLNAWHYEANMSANAAIGYVIWVSRPNGTQSVIVNSNRGTESGTSIAESSWTATPTSTTLNPGDCIVAGVFFDDASGTTMATGYQLFFGHDGGTGTGQYDSSITFTENLSFLSAASGTTTNLLSASSDISGTGYKKIWTDSASSQATYTVNTSEVPGQWTSTAGGSTVEWYTPQLSATTIEGYFSASLYGQESNASANTTYLILVFKTASDGTNPIKVGQGAAVNELSVGADASVSIVGHIKADISNGERLRVLVYRYSCAGAYAVSSYQATLVVEGSTVSSITWPATLTEYSSGSSLSIGPGMAMMIS